jgi:hypothetical protein
VGNGERKKGRCKERREKDARSVAKTRGQEGSGTHVDKAGEKEVAVRREERQSERLDRQRGFILGLARVILVVGELGSDKVPAVDDGVREKRQYCSFKGGVEDPKGKSRHEKE